MAVSCGAQKLKRTCFANPFRNERLIELMGTLEKQMGRAVAHKPEMLEEVQLRMQQTGGKATVQSILKDNETPQELRTALRAMTQATASFVGSDAHRHGLDHRWNTLGSEWHASKPKSLSHGYKDRCQRRPAWAIPYTGLVILHTIGRP